MTVIAAATLGDSLYMAADRLVIVGGLDAELREDESKLLARPGLVAGLYGRTFESRIARLFDDISAAIGSCNHEELVAGKWVRASEHYNATANVLLQEQYVFPPLSMLCNASFILGVTTDVPCLYHDNGTGSPLERCGPSVWADPGFTGIKTGPQFHSEAAVVDWLRERVMRAAISYPKSCSGIDIIRADKTNVEPLLSESIAPHAYNP